MNVDRWFFEKSKKYQIISLLIPVYGWIIEILIRLCVCLRKPKPMNWLGLILFGLLGMGWFPIVLDVLYYLFVSKEHLLLWEGPTEEEEEKYQEKLEQEKATAIENLDRSKLKEK